MTPGYAEFEFNLPEALLSALVKVFAGVGTAPLLPGIVAGIPEEQGVYQLFLEDDEGNLERVYIGKTDAEAGLKIRLSRHAKKIHHRVGLDPARVKFAAVRVYVFTAVDLETQLINYYGKTAPVRWNNSGFGSNDPGRERDTTDFKDAHFDTAFPIDIGRNLSFVLPPSAPAATYLQMLKQSLPYLIRFQNAGGKSRQPHPDLVATGVTLDPTKPSTPESIIAQVIGHLPSGWHATMLPSHVIMYKNDTRTFPRGRLIARSP